MKNYKYIYGPVNSWRLGNSLGIDLISSKDKVCNFDCIYCQLGKTKKLTNKRDIFIKTYKIIREFKSFDFNRFNIDYITFSGTGEPTLALNLGEVINKIKQINKNTPIAVLTNSSLICNKNVQKDLSLADLVVFKLDAACMKDFKNINAPIKNIKLEKIVECIKDFSINFKRKISLQIMFLSQNKKSAADIAKLAYYIYPDEVQINTPLRPSFAKPLSKKELDSIEKEFKNLKIKNVYYNITSNTSNYIDKQQVEKRRFFKK